MNSKCRKPINDWSGPHSCDYLKDHSGKHSCRCGKEWK